MNQVPQRGDGFDTKPPQSSENSSLQVTPENKEEIQTGIQNIQKQGFDLKNLTVNQIMAIGKVSQSSARLIKNGMAFTGGGSGAMIAREINEKFGHIVSDKFAEAIGGFIGGFVSGSINDTLRGANKFKGKRR
jgi:hypothetical protein